MNKLIKSIIIVISLCFIADFNTLYAQSIDADNINNLLNSKQNNGIEKFEDVKDLGW